MQQLHLVGLTTDLDGLVCSARKGTKSGGFVLRVDEHLLQVLAEAVSRRNADGVELEVPAALQPASASAPRRQSHLSPREIQDRLRAGRSLEEIAIEAGVGEEWVARFAAPVEAERTQVVGRARRLTYYRPRHGDSGETLGMSVRWNLADRGVRLANDEFDAAWSAYQLADTAWMVTFRYEARKREHEAEWEVDLATNELLSRNRLATELGYVEPGRRRRAMASLQPAAPAAAVRARVAAAEGDGDGAGEAGGAGSARARSAGKASAARRTSAKKGPAKRSPAGRSSTTRSSAKKTKKAPAAKKAAAKRSPAGRSAVKKATAAKRSPAGRPAAKRAPARASAAKRSPAKKASAATRAPAKRSAATKAAAKKSPAKRSAAKRATGRAPAKKAAGRSTTRRTGRGVPPARATPLVAVADDRPVPNELGRRRLQLVAGTAPSRPAARRPGVPGSRTGAPMPGVRIAAARSGDVAPVRRPPPPEEIVAPEPGLDVSDSEAAAEARRAERRRARAARNATPTSTPTPSPGRADDGEGQVVTIRANRATPPRGDAELVLPPDRPPLRPAQPATQPRKRRFTRSGR